MHGFGLGVAAEAAGKASIGAAIGVHHQDDPPGPVQPYRLANLVQHELTFGLVLRRSQAFGATGDFNGVTIHHADALEELAKAQVKPVIEAPQDGRVALILIARSFEMKNFFHDDPSGLCSAGLWPAVPRASRPRSRRDGGATFLFVSPTLPAPISPNVQSRFCNRRGRRC